MAKIHAAATKHANIKSALFDAYYFDTNGIVPQIALEAFTFLATTLCCEVPIHVPSPDLVAFTWQYLLDYCHAPFVAKPYRNIMPPSIYILQAMVRSLSFLPIDAGFPLIDPATEFTDIKVLPPMPQKTIATTWFGLYKGKQRLVAQEFSSMRKGSSEYASLKINLKTLGLFRVTGSPALLRCVGLSLNHQFDGTDTITVFLLAMTDYKDVAWNSPKKDLSVLLDVLDGVMVLHQSGIAHLNLFPRSILIDAAGRGVLGGISNCRRFTPHGYHDLAGGHAQLNWYSAPELFPGHCPVGPTGVDTAQILTPNADLFSLGLMLAEVMLGSHPFGTPGEPEREDVIRGLATLPDRLPKMIQRCLVEEPANRPSFEELRAWLFNVLTSL